MATDEFEMFVHRKGDLFSPGKVKREGLFNFSPLWTTGEFRKKIGIFPPSKVLGEGATREVNTRCKYVFISISSISIRATPAKIWEN